jgi:hypothetical protein
MFCLEMSHLNLTMATHTLSSLWGQFLQLATGSLLLIISWENGMLRLERKMFQIMSWKILCSSKFRFRFSLPSLFSCQMPPLPLFVLFLVMDLPRRLWCSQLSQFE